MFCLLVLALAASVSANCPQVTPVDNFNFAAFAQGIWYEVARYPSAIEAGTNCVTQEYSLDGDEATVKGTLIKNNKAQVIEGTAKLAHNARKTGRVVFNLSYEDGTAISDTLMNIVGVEYDKYLVGYSCKTDAFGQTSQELAWVLSRTKSLNAETKLAVNKIIRDSNILEAGNFIWPKFTNEACRVK